MPRRLVVGQRAARRARPQRPARARRHGGALGARRHRPAAESRFELRVPAQVRRFGRLRLREPVLLELPLGRSPPQGARPRGDRDGSPAEAAEERLRRAHLARGATACTSSCAPIAGGWSASAAGSAASPTGCARGSRRRSRPGFTASAAAWSKASSSATSRRSRTSCATASAPRGSTTCSRSRARTSRSSPAARSRSRGCSACRAGSASSARSRRSAATCSRSARSRRSSAPAIAGALGSLAWLAREAGGPLVLPAARRARAARLEPVHPARRRLPALVRGGRGDLRARAALRAGARGLSAARRLAAGACGLDRVRPRDRADPLAPVPRGSAADGAGERARRAGGRRRCSGSAFAAALAGLVYPPARQRVAWLNGWCAAYLAACARLVGGLPGAQVRSGRGLLVAARRRSRLLPPMLGGGGRARRGLPDHRHRPPEGRRAPCAASATASARTRPSSSPPQEASGEDAVAACNALGLFGGERRLVVVDGGRALEGRRREGARRSTFAVPRRPRCSRSSATR